LKYLIFVVLLLLTACSNQLYSYPDGYENASGQNLLIEGLRLHEAGDFEQAIVFFDAAYHRFEEEGNEAKMAESLSAKSLTLRRFSRLEEAEESLQSAVQLTEGTGGVFLPRYNLAKVQEQMGSAGCIETYRIALSELEEFRPSPHYRDAVINDVRLHLAVAELMFNQDDGTAEQRAVEAINAIVEDEQLDAFGKMVWASGGYIGLSRYYIQIDAETAWSYFDLAEEIVFDYPDPQVLRRQDIETLRAEMPPRPSGGD
jgi:tetratricopeptide (TPR) repeat protein